MEFFSTLGIVLLTVAVNGLFAAYEMALASVSYPRLLVLVEQKRRGAAAALFMKERMEASLAVVQLGITLAGVIGAATGGVAIEESAAPWLQTTLSVSEPTSEFIALALFVIPLSFLMIIFAELVPKMLAIQNKEAVCLALSPFMKAIARVTYPVVGRVERLVKFLVALGTRSSKPTSTADPQAWLHEFKAAVALARAGRILGAREERIALSAAHLSVRSVREIMLPAADIAMLPITIMLADALGRANLEFHTRFPVCEVDGDPQSIRGYVNLKDIIVRQQTEMVNRELVSIVRPIKSISEHASIAQALEEMIREKMHIVLVRAKDQRVLGMVALEDIVEELVGEIEDEFDRLPSHVHPSGSGWIIGGGVPMTTVAATAGWPWTADTPDERIANLAEWCAKRLGREPRGGETIEHQGLSVFVRKLRRGKVFEAFVAYVQPPYLGGK